MVNYRNFLKTLSLHLHRLQNNWAVDHVNVQMYGLLFQHQLIPQVFICQYGNPSHCVIAMESSHRNCCCAEQNTKPLVCYKYRVKCSACCVSLRINNSWGQSENSSPTLHGQCDLKDLWLHFLKWSHFSFCKYLIVIPDPD